MDVPRSPSTSGVYILKSIRFARVCSNMSDFHNRQFLTAKLCKKVIDIMEFAKHFLNSSRDTQSYC